MNEYRPLRHLLVATVLTVYGIETEYADRIGGDHPKLQQYLPFTVLKRNKSFSFKVVCCNSEVATVLTVYGIET